MTAGTRSPVPPAPAPRHQAVATPAVASLALLKVIWDRKGRDYLSTFVPIVVEAIRRAGMTVVALADLQGRVETDFGLRVPQHALQAVLRRAQREGYVKVENHVYVVETANLGRNQFDRVQREMTRIHDDLIRDLVTFAKEQHSLDWTTAIAEQALLDQLRQRRLQLGAVADEPILKAGTVPRGDRYIVAAYVAYLQGQKSPRLRDLEAIAQGYMLANVLYLPDPGQTTKRFRRTLVYFDTPFLIYALGYAGPAREAPARELLELLYRTGASMRCFRHTRDEIRGALEACAGHVRRGPDAHLRGPAVETVQFFLSQGFTSSDVELIASRLERSLETLHITVVEAPTYSDHQYVIDEAGLRRDLKEQIPLYREGALDRDVDSVAAIVRARAGRVTTTIEDSSAIFVTTNYRLVRVVRTFFARDNSTYSVAPCITDYSLTNLLWLKRPTDAPGLPMKRLLADCYAALQPDDELWSAFEAEARRLRDNQTITPDDYYDLRYSLSAKTELMEVTHGEPEVVVQGTVLDVLGEVQRQREEAARAAVADEIAESHRQRSTAERDAATTKAQLRAQRETLDLRAQKHARITARAAFALAGLLLLAGTVATSPWGAPLLAGSLLGYVLTALGALFLIAALYGLMFGGTVRDVARHLEIALERRFRTVWYRVAGIHDTTR